MIYRVVSKSMEDFDTGQAEDVTLRLNVGSTGVPEIEGGQIAQSDLLIPGSLFLGKYNIHGRIGSGGMGVVYRCTQILMSKEMAIKTLNKSSMNDEAVQRFQTEAKAAGQLSHPNLVSVYDFGVTEDGMPYMVMDFVPGRTLQDVLSEHGQLKLEIVIDIFIECADGLAHAHENKVYHRDIKPSNIVLLQEENIGPGTIRILDFGIAKIASDGQQTQELTKTGVVIGSPLYMSPEQGIGKRMDARTDIYSLGCVLFECLCGCPPFQGESVIETMMLHQTETPLTLKEASLGREFPCRLQELVSSMMAKNVDNRINSMVAVHHELVEIRDQMKNPGRAKKVIPEAAKQLNDGKNKWISTPVIIGAIAVFIVGISIFMVSLLNPPEKPVKKMTFDDGPPIHQDMQAAYDHRVSKSIAESKSRGDMHVSIGGVEFSQRQFEIIAREKWIRDVILKECQGITASGLDTILKNQIETLNFRECDLRDECLAAIARCKTLHHLSLAECSSITAGGLLKIANMKDLMTLNLSCTPVRDDFLEVLAKKQQKYLDLDISRNSFINDNSMRILAKFKDPLVLNISSTSVSDKGLKPFGDNLIGLLMIGDRRVSDKGMEILAAQCPNLKVIQLAGTSVTAKGILQLAKLKNLKDLQIERLNIDAGSRKHIRTVFRAKKVNLHDF